MKSILRMVGYAIFTFFILTVHTTINKNDLGFSYSSVKALRKECEATIPRNQTCEVLISVRAKEETE